MGIKPGLICGLNSYAIGFLSTLSSTAVCWTLALTTDHSFLCPYYQGQHYEEEKRAMNHEIVALNSHLLDAKVTIDKLSEDNVSAMCIWLLEGMWQECSGAGEGASQGVL